MCRQKNRACPFRRFENNEPQAGPRERERAAKKGKHRASTPILITDSESSEEEQVAGPSSRPGRGVGVRDSDGWEKLKETLLVARKRKVEIETEAEIELAKVNSIIEEAERKLKKSK
jgi:hypothetical protein